MTIIANKAYKNLNCKIDKSVSDKLEKFIADTKLSKTATVEKHWKNISTNTIKQARFKKKKTAAFPLIGR